VSTTPNRINFLMNAKKCGKPEKEQLLIDVDRLLASGIIEVPLDALTVDGGSVTMKGSIAADATPSIEEGLRKFEASTSHDIEPLYDAVCHSVEEHAKSKLGIDIDVVLYNLIPPRPADVQPANVVPV
jgi:hypothetical protein